MLILCCAAAGCGARDNSGITKAGGSAAFTATSSAAAAGPFVAGTRDGGVYTSQFAGFPFTLPEGWVFATDAEAMSLLSTTADTLSVPGQTYEKFDNDLNSICDLVCGQQYTNASSLFIAFEDTTAYLGGTSMTESDYADAFWTAASDPDVNPAYEGVEPVISTVTLSGESWTSYLIDLTETYGLCQTLYFHRFGNYFCSLTYTCVGTPDEAAFLGQFAPIA